MMFKKLFLSLFCAVFLCSLPLSYAQDSTADNVDVLTSLYSSHLDQPENVYFSNRIEEERVKLRDELKVFYVSTYVENTKNETQSTDETISSYDRTKSTIATLEELLKDATIELDVLMLEDERVYHSEETTEEELIKVTTTSYEELLAKKLVQEERIAVLSTLIAQQKEKLSLLNKAQVQDHFSGLIQVGWYLLAILLVIILERWVQYIVVNKIQDKNKRYASTKLVGVFFYGGTVLVFAIMLFYSFPGILTSFAIIGAGLAVAMQDLVKDIVGWILIQQRKIFAMGDRISIGGITGDVIDVSLLRFTLLHVEDFGKADVKVFEHTGKTVSIPNADVVTQQVINHTSTSNYLRYEMRVCITFESNREKAETILHEIVQDVAGVYAEKERKQRNQRTRRFFVPIDPVDITLYKSIVASGFEFTMRFVAPIGEGRAVVSILSDRVMKAFDDIPDVNLAYDTIRVIPTP